MVQVFTRTKFCAFLLNVSKMRKNFTRFKHKNNYAKTSKDLKNDFAT